MTMDNLEDKDKNKIYDLEQEKLQTHITFREVDYVHFIFNLQLHF